MAWGQNSPKKQSWHRKESYRMLFLLYHCQLAQWGCRWLFYLPWFRKVISWIRCYSNIKLWEQTSSSLKHCSDWRLFELTIYLLCPKALRLDRLLLMIPSELLRNMNETWGSSFCLWSAASDWTSPSFKDRREIFFTLVSSNGKSILLLSKIWLQIALRENESSHLISISTLGTLFSDGVSQLWFEAFQWKVELFSPFEVKRRVIYWHSNSSSCGLLHRDNTCMQEHKWPQVT